MSPNGEKKVLYGIENAKIELKISVKKIII